MSESDSFIKEVSEEVRQDRMFRLWKRYGPYVLGIIVVIVSASAAWNWMKHREIVAARERGQAFIDAGDSAPQIEVLAGTQEGDVAALARLRLAAALAQDEDVASAAEVYRQIVGSDAPAAYRDLALLRAIQLEALSGDPAALASELEPLTAEGAPYRALALELRGMLRVNAGNFEAARADLEAASSDPAATVETRRRVGELMNALAPRGAAATEAAPGGDSGEAAQDDDAATEGEAEVPEPASEADTTGSGNGSEAPAEEAAAEAGEAAPSTETAGTAAEDGDQNPSAGMEGAASESGGQTPSADAADAAPKADDGSDSATAEETGAEAAAGDDGAAPETDNQSAGEEMAPDTGGTGG